MICLTNAHRYKGTKGADSNKKLFSPGDIDVIVQMRDTKDAQLDMPALILPSIQVNNRAGALPEGEDNGTR